MAGWFYAAAGYASDGGTITAKAVSWVVTLPFRGAQFCLYWLGAAIDTPAELPTVADFGDQPNVPNPTWQGKAIPHEGKIQ